MIYYNMSTINNKNCYSNCRYNDKCYKPCSKDRWGKSIGIKDNLVRSYEAKKQQEFVANIVRLEKKVNNMQKSMNYDFPPLKLNVICTKPNSILISSNNASNWQVYMARVNLMIRKINQIAQVLGNDVYDQVQRISYLYRYQPGVSINRSICTRISILERRIAYVQPLIERSQ